MDQEATTRRIDLWIERLEAKAQLLMDGIDLSGIEEMTTKERIDGLTKITSTIQRFIMLKQQIDSSTTTGSENTLTAALIRQLRGEEDIE